MEFSQELLDILHVFGDGQLRNFSGHPSIQELMDILKFTSTRHHLTTTLSLRHQRQLFAFIHWHADSLPQDALHDFHRRCTDFVVDPMARLYLDYTAQLIPHSTNDTVDSALIITPALVVASLQNIATRSGIQSDDNQEACQGFLTMKRRLEGGRRLDAIYPVTISFTPSKHIHRLCFSRNSFFPIPPST